MKLSFRLRLTLWYTGLLAVALITYSAVVYGVMSGALVSNLDTSLELRLAQVDPEVRSVHGTFVLNVKEEAADLPVVPVALLSLDGRSVDGRLPAGVERLLSERGTPPSAVHFFSAREVRVATRPLLRGGKLVGYLVAYRSLDSVLDARRSLLYVILVVLPLVVVLAAAGGLVLARRALSPVHRVTKAASEISATDLHRRVDVGRGRDELSELSSTFNAMISRLEAAVQRERRFTSDASHELRSPLAVIRAEATLALEKERSPEAYARVLEAIDDQAQEMESLVAALLTLARLESGGFDRVPVSVLHVAQRAVALAGRAGEREDVTVTVEVPPDIEVSGSEQLLSRAVYNLIDNALKASPPGGAVRVAGKAGGGEVTICVRDEGSGVSAEHHDRIFEPFYQVETARTPGSSHGLGLAICRRIAETHGGTVFLHSRPGHGACFTITLPRLLDSLNQKTEVPRA